jgi:hypothetical protein
MYQDGPFGNGYNKMCPECGVYHNSINYFCSTCLQTRAILASQNLNRQIELYNESIGNGSATGFLGVIQKICGLIIFIIGFFSVYQLGKMFLGIILHFF